MNTLVQLWKNSEGAHPDKVALIAAGRRLMYRQVGDQIRQLRRALRCRWGVSPGDVVAILLPNSIEFVTSYFAVVTSGAIVQPLDERLAGMEITSLLLDSKARFLIVHESLWRKVREERQTRFIERILVVGDSDGEEDLYGEWLLSEPPTDEEREIDPSAVAELMYTSGTTGVPKGVMRSHRNVRAASQNAIKGFGYRGEDVIAIAMPLSHSSALVSQMVPLLELGGTVVLFEKFEPATLLAAVQQEGITCMRAVPAMIKLLLASREFCAERLPSFRLLVNSSATIEPNLYGAVKKRFPGIKVMNSYGLTEASTCTVLEDAAACTRPDSIGIPIEGVEMCVMDSEGRIIDNKDVGEIVVRGEHVFTGYWGKADETADAFVDGWLRTGDLGYRDAEGFYYLVGRKSEMINCGGRKVIPNEIENCIRQIQDVADVVVVAAPHRVLGQVPLAFVVPRPSTMLEGKAIVRHCARSLASYKVPFAVEVVNDLPRNSLGKVLRRQVSTGSSLKTN